MEIVLDPANRRFLTRKVQSGKFESPSEVVSFALQQLRKDERDLLRLRQEIGKGIEELNIGASHPWNVKSEKARLLKRVDRRRGNA